MEIGTKLKNARIAAEFTQEQVADVLGVSRQTISNWENNKTYPDIINVIKLSDLYAVSLDHLLKEQEELPMSNYMDYLEESTNTVKSKTRLSETILIAAYLCIWAIGLIFFWFFMSGSDAFGFALVYFWIILPITTFVISLLVGKNNYWGRYKWFAVIILGILYMLADFATFKTANMIAFGKTNLPNFTMIMNGAIISAVGLGIGTFLHHRKCCCK